MIDWKSSKGTVFRIAAPYTLIVPQAYPEAMNLYARILLDTRAHRGIAFAALCLLRQPVLRFHVLGGGSGAAGCDPAYSQSDDDTVIRLLHG